MNHKKELPRSLWVGQTVASGQCEETIAVMPMMIKRVTKKKID